MIKHNEERIEIYMPTYLYECEKCGRFEKFQKITEKPLSECPECSSPVKRIIGAPGIVFKGSGFYCTDNSKKKEESKTNKEKTNKEKTNNVKAS